MSNLSSMAINDFTMDHLNRQAQLVFSKNDKWQKPGKPYLNVRFARLLIRPWIYILVTIFAYLPYNF